MAVGVSTDGVFPWPEIVYRQVGHKLIACVAEEGGIRDVYPTPDRRYRMPAIFPREALGRLNTLNRASRRKLERLVAYCPRNCPVLVVYVVNGWLLLRLAGDVLMTYGFSGKVLTSAEKPGKAAYLPHQPKWLQSPPDQADWVVKCIHGHYLIDTFEAFTAACSALVARRRRTVAVATLAPGRSQL